MLFTARMRRNITLSLFGDLYRPQTIRPLENCFIPLNQLNYFSIP